MSGSSLQSLATKHGLDGAFLVYDLYNLIEKERRVSFAAKYITKAVTLALGAPSWGALNNMFAGNFLVLDEALASDRRFKKLHLQISVVEENLKMTIEQNEKLISLLRNLLPKSLRHDYEALYGDIRVLAIVGQMPREPFESLERIIRHVDEAIDGNAVLRAALLAAAKELRATSKKDDTIFDDLHTKTARRRLQQLAFRYQSKHVSSFTRLIQLRNGWAFAVKSRLNRKPLIPELREVKPLVRADQNLTF